MIKGKVGDQKCRLFASCVEPPFYGVQQKLKIESVQEIFITTI